MSLPLAYYLSLCVNKLFANTHKTNLRTKSLFDVEIVDVLDSPRRTNGNTLTLQTAVSGSLWKKT